MKKFIALIIGISLLYLNLHVSKAEEPLYHLNIERQVFLNSENKYNLINTLNLNNISPKLIITSLDYFLPVSFNDAEASIGDKKLDFEVKGTNVHIDLGDSYIKPLNSHVITLKFNAPDLLTVSKNSQGQILGSQLFLPKDTTKAIDLTTETKINFDGQNLKPSYISNEAVIDGNSIQYTQNNDMFISFTDIGGVSIKFSGKDPTTMLPSTNLNKVFYDDIPQNADLIKDKRGNNYLVSKNNINYQIKAVQRKDIEWDNTEGQNTYFTKEELSSFDLEKDEAFLYRQMLTKFNPDPEKFNVQYQNYSQIENQQTQDPLGYALTYASLLQQKGIPAEVVFGRVQFPLTDVQSWHFWVMYKTDNIYKEVDPYMEDKLGFDGFNNVPKSRIIFADYHPDPQIIAGINGLLSGDLKMDFLTTLEGNSQILAGKLSVIDVPDSFYPMLKINFKNYDTNKVTIKGIYINDFNVPGIGEIELAPGSQRDIEVFIGLNIFDLLLKRGDFKASIQVFDGSKDVYYSSTGKIPESTFYWIVGINLVVVTIAGILIILRKKNKKVWNNTFVKFFGNIYYSFSNKK